MRENLVTVFQTDRIHRGGKDLYDHSVNLDAIIFSHMQFLFVLQKNETKWEFYADEGRMARKIPSSQLANAKRRFAKLTKSPPIPHASPLREPVTSSITHAHWRLVSRYGCRDSRLWLSGLPTRHRDIRMSALKIFPPLQKLVVLVISQPLSVLVEIIVALEEFVPFLIGDKFAGSIAILLAL